MMTWHMQVFNKPHYNLYYIKTASAVQPKVGGILLQ